MRVGVPIRAAASTPIPAATRTARKPRRRRYLRGAKLQSGGILLCASLCLTMGESASRGALPHIPSFRKKIIIIITMIKKKKNRGAERRSGGEVKEGAPPRPLLTASPPPGSAHPTAPSQSRPRPPPSSRRGGAGPARPHLGFLQGAEAQLVHEGAPRRRPALSAAGHAASPAAAAQLHGGEGPRGERKREGTERGRCAATAAPQAAAGSSGGGGSLPARRRPPPSRGRACALRAGYSCSAGAGFRVGWEDAGGGGRERGVRGGGVRLPLASCRRPQWWLHSSQCLPAPGNGAKAAPPPRQHGRGGNGRGPRVGPRPRGCTSGGPGALLPRVCGAAGCRKAFCSAQRDRVSDNGKKGIRVIPLR